MLKWYVTMTSVFFVIKHDFNYIFQHVLIIFYNSTSLSHAMQDAMSWRGWVLKTMNESMETKNFTKGPIMVWILK